MSDTLHDRITALADEWTEQARRARAGDYGSRVADEANTLDNAARRLRAVLAETTTAQPEADAVERAARVLVDAARRAGQVMGQDYAHDLARAALAAAQPVEPEADEREALTCRTFDEAGKSVCDSPARFIVWGHLYEKRNKGPKCGRHLPAGALLPSGFGKPAIYEIPGFRRSRPEATHTVTAEEVRLARRLADDRMYHPLATVHSWGDVFLAALGVTVADTPTQAGGAA